MAGKEVTGVIVSDKMDKSVVVAVERQIRHDVYGKTQRRTSKFLAHNEKNDAKVGDRVAIAETRPMSRRKRVDSSTRVIEKAKELSRHDPDAFDPRRGRQFRRAEDRRRSTPSADRPVATPGSATSSLPRSRKRRLTRT